MKPLSIFSFSLLLPAVLAGACADPVGRYEEHAERVLDAGSARVDATPLAELPDITGSFLIGMSAAVAPEPPFQFLGVAELVAHPDGTGTVQLSLTALGVTDRMPIGDAILSDVPVSTGGQFEAVFAGTLPAAANPVIPSDVVVEGELLLTIHSADLFCGEVVGQVTSPVIVDLAGSTVGAVRVPQGTVGGDLPDTVVSACP
jgi:hypothetical protein